jgi:hypothetical protein
MMPVVLALAVACALRGTWSPCGLSMLSTITPLGERARGHRYAWTASWYVAGAVVGGAVLGVGMLGAAVLVRALPGVEPAALAALGLATTVCLAADAGLGGLRLPDVPRQLNERWVDRMRPWAYASGFGVQVGVGVATYVMTFGIYALVAAGVFDAAPLDAFGLGVVFGTCRGLSIFIGARAGTPEQLRTLHRRLQAAAPWSILLPAAAEMALLVAVVRRSGSPVAVVAGVVVASLLGVAVFQRARRGTLLGLVGA